MTLPPFWSLVERHGAELHRYAGSLVGAPDADDVFQETMLRALRSYPRLRHADHLRAWLYRIATTTAFDHTARRAGEVPVGDVSEDAHVYDGYDEGRFEELLVDLSDAARRALTLRFVDDLPYSVIAKRLGCTEPAARQRVSSAVRTLRRKLT